MPLDERQIGSGGFQQISQLDRAHLGREVLEAGCVRCPGGGGGSGGYRCHAARAHGGNTARFAHVDALLCHQLERGGPLFGWPLRAGATGAYGAARAHDLIQIVAVGLAGVDLCCGTANGLVCFLGGDSGAQVGKGVAARGGFGLLHLLGGLFHQTRDIRVRCRAHLGLRRGVGGHGLRLCRFASRFLCVGCFAFCCDVGFQFGKFAGQISLCFRAQRRTLGQGRLAQGLRGGRGIAFFLVGVFLQHAGLDRSLQRGAFDLEHTRARCGNCWRHSRFGRVIGGLFIFCVEHIVFVGIFSRIRAVHHGEDVAIHLVIAVVFARLGSQGRVCDACRIRFALEPVQDRSDIVVVVLYVDLVCIDLVIRVCGDFFGVIGIHRVFNVAQGVGQNVALIIRLDRFVFFREILHLGTLCRSGLCDCLCFGCICLHMLVFGVVLCRRVLGLLGDNSANALELVGNAAGFGGVYGGCALVLELGNGHRFRGGLALFVIGKEGLDLCIWQAGDDVGLVFGLRWCGRSDTELRFAHHLGCLGFGFLYGWRCFGFIGGSCFVSGLRFFWRVGLRRKGYILNGQFGLCLGRLCHRRRHILDHVGGDRSGGLGRVPG